jgi:gamma-glutamylcyclotransferase (GGCT)/AIG2-like uncharacterized protein YtfP
MSKYKRLHVTTKHVDEWYAEPFGYPMLVDSDGKVVGMCLSSDAGYDHLFAAAPDMLEALEALLESAIQAEHFEHNSYNPPTEIHEMMANGDFSKRIFNAIAAIAKAKGEQP